jgi:cobalamin biosynthesis protein CobT
MVVSFTKLAREISLMARRILNRKDMRADFDAAERRKETDEVPDEDEEESEDEDEDEEGDDEEGDDEEAEGDEAEGEPEAEGDEDDEEKPAPKKKKKVAKAKPVKEPRKSRARTPKVIRQRVVWGVFSNSHQCVATYEYPRRAEADQHAARLMQDKKSTHFVQPVKEPWEEREKDKKEK